jgi:DNA segregation ATPase FtsK/SpoIIIE, S-DNA-T family
VQIGGLAGRIAREARSAGVTLILGTQRLTAKILDGIPGSQDLRTNLARILLGATALGERQSALRNPYDVPEITETKPGRGLWEPLQGPGSTNALMIQSWYASQDAYSAALARRIAPLPPEAILDVTSVEPSGLAGQLVGGGTPETVVEHDDLVISLDDLDLDFTTPDSALSPAAPEGVDPVDIAPGAVVPDWFAESYKQQVREARGEQAPTETTTAGGDDVGAAASMSMTEPTAEEIIETDVVWDRIDPSPWLPADGAGTYGWDEIDALLGFLEDFPEVEYVEWSDPHLSDLDEMGVTFAETARDLLIDRGLRLGGLLSPASGDFQPGSEPPKAVELAKAAAPGRALHDEDPFSAPGQVAPGLLPDLDDDPFG